MTTNYAVNTFDAHLSKIETDLAVLGWMLGFVLAGVVTLIFKAFA